MDHRMYTMAEAADIADMPLDELRRAVRDGVLAVRMPAGSGELRVASEELGRFVCRPRHADPFGREKKHKVLILGEDLLFAGTLKLELQRDPRLDVRYASWGLDALVMVEHYRADLYVVDLTPSKALPDEVLSAVKRQRASDRVAAVAYYAAAEGTLDGHPLVQSRLADLAPEAALSKAKGLRALTIECLKALGLDTTTRLFRLHG